MSSESVYIAEMASIMPKRYCSVHVSDRMYSTANFGPAVNKMAKRFAALMGVPLRSAVIDLDLFEQDGQNELANLEDHPKTWGKSVVEQLTTRIPRKNIGYFNLSYNISYHQDTLPNLASQIVMDSDLTEIERADELSHYGCAASIFSLDQAVQFCKETGKPAIVFTFDQCTVAHQKIEANDSDFRRMMVSNLLFNDAGVGLLLVPESLREAFQRPLLRIRDIQTGYQSGNLIGMTQGRFLMNDGVKDVMPKLASTALIRPFLEKNGLNTNSVHQWSIHQGGTEVLKQFANADVLGLSDQQLERSLELFHQYGNTSAASCLLVLKSFFDDPEPLNGDRTGMLVGFGAGYYFGAMLYDWQ